MGNSIILPATLANLHAGLDKDLLTGTTFDLTGGTAVYMLTHPILVANVAAFGLFQPGSTLSILTCDGPVLLYTVPSIEQRGEPVTCMQPENFQPVYISGMLVTVPMEQESQTQVLLEIIGLKVIEVKAATNLNPIVDGPLFTAIEVLPTYPVQQNPADPTDPMPFTVPPGLFGYGIEVGKDDHEYQLEIVIGTVGETPPATYNGKVDWYFSPDNIAWYYFASQELDDVAGAVGGNPNPSGWNDEETDLSYRNLAVPEHGYGRYVAVVVRNESVTDAFTIIHAALLRQR